MKNQNLLKLIENESCVIARMIVTEVAVTRFKVFVEGQTI